MAVLLINNITNILIILIFSSMKIISFIGNKSDKYKKAYYLNRKNSFLLYLYYLLIYIQNTNVSKYGYLKKCKNNNFKGRYITLNILYI